MGTAGQAGIGTGFEVQSGLGETSQSTDFFRDAHVSPACSGLSAGGKQVYRMGSSLGYRGATLGLEQKAFTRLSCSFHLGPDKPSSLVYIHFLPGMSISISFQY